MGVCVLGRIEEIQWMRDASELDLLIQLNPGKIVTRSLPIRFVTAGWNFSTDAPIGSLRPVQSVFSNLMI